MENEDWGMRRLLDIALGTGLTIAQDDDVAVCLIVECRPTDNDLNKLAKRQEESSDISILNTAHRELRDENNSTDFDDETRKRYAELVHHSSVGLERSVAVIEKARLVLQKYRSLPRRQGFIDTHRSGPESLI